MCSFPLFPIASALSVLLNAALLGQEKPSPPPARDSYAAVSRDEMKLLNELTDILESVKDESMVESAVRKIQSLTQRQRDCERRFKQFGKPNKDDEDALKPFQADMDKAANRFSDRFTRVMKDAKQRRLLDEVVRLMMTPSEAPKPRPGVVAGINP